MQRGSRVCFYCSRINRIVAFRMRDLAPSMKTIRPVWTWRDSLNLFGLIASFSSLVFFLIVLIRAIHAL